MSLFERSSPKARTVKSSALVGAAVGAFLSVLVIVRVLISAEFRAGGAAYLVGGLIGGLIQGVLVSAVFAGFGALTGLVIASCKRLPGKAESAFGAHQPPTPVFQSPVPAGWYPDPHGSELQRYWDGEVWTEHTAPAAPGR
ncbi:DUF2510 domain-containing protein [Gordonia caeni]|uniref:DUF2510 domain-containing protein n=1 Tax=Gordonia caeni TaxID=1007097 RepID=UPI0031D19477